MTLFKLIAHLVLSLITIWVTRRVFRERPGWRLGLTLFLGIEAVVFTVLSFAGMPDGLYATFNNFWIGLWVFLSIYLIFWIILLFSPQSRRKALLYPAYLGAAFMAILLGIIGHQSFSKPALTEYDITLSQTAPKDSIRILLVTDLHIGPIVGTEEIAHLRQLTKGLKADYLIFGGDMIDRKLSYALDEDVMQEMRELIVAAVPSGRTYFILGNHEYYSDTDGKIKWISSLGTLLRDSVVLLPEGVCLVGRDSSQGYGRQDLAPLTKDIPDETPMIILAHEPEKRGKTDTIDRPALYLHGHTHNGQLFLFRPLIYLIHDEVYGRYDKGGSTHITSSGYGVSTSTLRIGTRSEAVLLTVRL